jgi:hypothetical protein
MDLRAAHPMPPIALLAVALPQVQLIALACIIHEQ